MRKKSSIEDIAFTFLALVSKSTVENIILTKIFQVLYQIVLILCFFITDNPTHQYSLYVLQTPFLGLITLIILAIVIVEIVVAVICNFQYELYHQLCLYRYVVFPLTVIFLVAEIYSPFYLYEAVAIILLSVVTIFTLVLSRLLFQPINIDKLWNFLYLQTCFVLTDVLMALKIIAVSNVSIWVLLLIWVTLEYILYRQTHYFDKYKSKVKLSSYINCLKQYFLFIWIFKQIFQSQTKSLMLIIASWPVVIMMMAFQSCKNKQFMLTKQIFAGKAEISYFIQFARVISDELLKFKKFQSASFQESFLMVFISIHQNNCNNQNCPLLQPNSIIIKKQFLAKQLENSIAKDYQKMLKHIQYLSLKQLKLYKDKTSFSSLLHNPSSKQIKNIASHQLDIKPSLDLGLKNNLLQSEQQNQKDISCLNHRQHQRIRLVSIIQYIIFNSQTILKGTLVCLRQFWQELLAEKVDINHLMSISSKLFPFKKQVEQTWKKHLTVEKFTSWSILRTYIIYRKKILHDYMNSCILQDYCKIIEQKLKSKHEVGYMNFETERAVVTILLTDSSLGNISSVNSQACKLFSYPDRSQIMNLRVNDIMPSVISEVHDHILSTYLKDRYKRINQDQRLLFGKNKSGFIFPIYLQLRKLSWNANDELIFIANFELPKLKSAPICCISDLEGNILDYTSSFANLFLKKSKKKSAIQTKNIQQLIPSFFDVIQSFNEIDECNTFEFVQKVTSNKIPSSSHISFSASEFQIKGEKVGYIIEGQRINPVKKTSLDGKNINNLLIKSQMNQIQCNTFNPTTLTYQISSIGTAQENNIIERQFSIPFFNKEDVKHILYISDVQAKDFGKYIKTVRLNNGRLQQVVDQQSFFSDQNNQEWKEKLVLNRVEMMRQEGGIKDKKNIVYFYRFGVTLMASVLLLFCSIMLLQVKYFEQSQLRQEKNFAFKWTIRELLPEYLIYSNFPDNANCKEQMKIILKQLSQNLISAQIQEKQKQTIYKIIYGSSLFMDMSLPLNILDFNYGELEQTNIINLWYTICFFGLAFQIIIICMFLYYKYTMANIYVILLSITDKKLHSFSRQVDQLIEDLALNPSEQSSKLMVNQQYTMQKESDQFQRVKKFKTNFQRQYLQLFAQMTIPILILLTFSSFCTVFTTINYNHYKEYTHIWKQSSLLLSQSSITIMQSLMNSKHKSNFSLSTNFYQLEQSFERNLYQFEFDPNSNLEQLLKGNPCNQLQLLIELGVNTTSICSNQSKIFQHGLMGVLNFIMTNMANYKNQYQTHLNLTTQGVDWPLLIDLQFKYIKPLLSYSGQLIKTSIQNYRLSLQNIIIILTTIETIIVVLVIIYINCYPIQAIMQKLMHTKDLISIVPVDKQFVLKDVLTNLTTQAFEKA